MPDETLDPGNLPMEMRRGVQFGPITLELKDPTGAAVNLTGYTPRAIARPEIPSPNSFDLGAGIIPPATDGKIQLFVDQEDTTRLFPAGLYTYAITVKDGSEEIFGPFIQGQLTVLDQPARE
jgi:hypothetical protein